MKLKLYYSAINSLSADGLISTLKNRDKSQKHIIITPDKSSLYYERKLFEILNEDSFFDVATTTLSRFANNVVGKGNNILSKQGGILIVKRILLENKDKLISFNKSSELIGFAGNLFETICMFKSCNIHPSQIEDVMSQTLNNKLKDIKLVYEKYEEYLKEDYTDSFNRLNLCALKINKELFNNTNFYFIGFDDFTKQGYQIIEKLIKSANSVSISTTFAKKDGVKNNYNIYLNNIYYNIIDLAKLCGVNCDTIEIENNLPKEKKFLSEQIFAHKTNKYNDKQEFVELIKYNDINDEIKNTALNIKYNIINSKLRFKNFAVVVSDLNKYKTLIKDNFSDVGISYFLDESKKLKDTLLSRFVSNLISILNRPTKFNVINFLKSSLLNIKSNIVDKYYAYIDKYEPFGKDLLNQQDFEVGKYLSIILSKMNKEEDSVENLLNNVKEILTELEFEKLIDNLMKKYHDNNDIKNYRELNQSYNKIVKIFNEINVLNNYKCTYNELNKFYDLFAENTNIVVPPVVADAVFITDLNCINLNNIDYVYYLGFNEGLAPHYSVDSGIITDDEIMKMPLKSRLNPTINVINKRLKFKLFELMFVANKKAIISYPTKSIDGEMFPNNLITNLQVIYGIENIINGSNYIDLVNNNLINFDAENFAYNNFSKVVAMDNFVKLLKYWDNYSDNKNYIKTLSTLGKLIGDNTFIENMMYENNIEPLKVNLFLQKNKVGISEIERFNICPYMHFMDYGLKLKPSEKNDFSAIDLGNIIHEFAKQAIFRLNEDNISREILDNILKNEDYKYLTQNKRNNFVIKALYDEVERILKVLKYQQNLSSFITKNAELPFNFKICKLNDKDIYLTGVVDRIDTFENGIRIIDYKTGNISFKNYGEIGYGNKIQVVVYLSALSKEKDVKPLGALYLPISNAFAESKSEDLYQMEGIVENSLETLLAFDKNLSSVSYSSNIINLNTTTKGVISANNFYKNMCLNSEDMVKLCDYVLTLVKETILKINSNIISANPIDSDSCRYCEYRSICNFSTRYKNTYRKDKEIITFNDLMGVDNE